MIKYIGGLIIILSLASTVFFTKKEIPMIQGGEPISGAVSSSDTIAPPTTSKGVVLSPNTTLISNTEKKKVYTVKFSTPSGPTPSGCNQKEYKPDLGDGKNILGPFNFPVKLTYKGSIDDNLKINGVVVDKTSTLNGDPCSHHHDIEYSQTIPAGKAITISIIDQHGGVAAMDGTLTLENTVLKDTLTKLQKRASTDDYESGAIVTTFDRGMTKTYTTDTIICDAFGGIFKSPIEKCITDFTSLLDKIDAENTKYGYVIKLTVIHNHPENALKTLLPNQVYDMLPPSPVDLTLALGLMRPGYSLSNYGVDRTNIWNFSVNETTGFSQENIKAINAAELKRAINLKQNAQNYINVVNANGGSIRKIDLSKL